MPMEQRFNASPLALAVLCLLRVGPLHPYGIQRLMKEWGKDKVVNVGNRATLYRTINRLYEAGLVEVRQTERDHLYPERTVYELTEQGRRVGLEWLAEMVSVPRNEFPEFPAALSFAMVLGPDVTLARLEQRAERLVESLASLDADLDAGSATLPRVALIEDEYRRAIAAAELSWVRSVVDDLRSGALSWAEDILDPDAVRAVVSGPTAPGDER